MLFDQNVTIATLFNPFCALIKDKNLVVALVVLVDLLVGAKDYYAALPIAPFIDQVKEDFLLTKSVLLVEVSISMGVVGSAQVAVAN